MIFDKREINGSFRTSARRSESYYVQSSPIQCGVRGSGHSVLGKTKMRKLPVGKVILRDHGRLWTTPPPALKICTFLDINPLNAELNPICHLLALFAAHPILHVSG